MTNTRCIDTNNFSAKFQHSTNNCQQQLNNIISQTNTTSQNFEFVQWENNLVKKLKIESFNSLHSPYFPQSAMSNCSPCPNFPGYCQTTNYKLQVLKEAFQTNCSYSSSEVEVVSLYKESKIYGKLVRVVMKP